VASVGEFIRLYATRYGRWRSPKYLAGESYGTTRAAGLAAHLQDRLGINLNGVLLVSSVLNFQTIRFDEGNDLPFILFLPTYTATAWYHKKLPPDLQDDFQKALAESERFAQNEYTLALMQGDRMTEGQKQSVALQLSRLTGLSVEYIREANLRVDNLRFCKELLRDRRRTVGRYDSRLMGADAEAVGDRPDFDPSYAAVQGAYTAALNEYLRNDLHLVNDQLTYEVLTGRVQPWDFGTARNRYLNVASSLRSAMTKNLSLRLFVASGYFDLATPYLATDYTVVHLGLGVDLRDRITAAYYDAGHMMYIYKPAHDKLRRDLAAFLAGERGGASGGQ
jgi:carboxypeptidase C (cathepsin A)